MTNIFETKPDFVNELGVKWWRDEDTTRYAQKPNIHGVTLDVVCFFIEEKDGYRTRLLISKAGEIIEQDQTIDGMGTKIDVRKFLIRDHQINPEPVANTKHPIKQTSLAKKNNGKKIIIGVYN